MKRNIKPIIRLGSAVLLSLSAALTARADYSSTVLSQNPAAYYHLNETVQPATYHPTNSGSLGASADGTYNGLPSVNQPGPFAGSVSVGLNGTSQSITTPWVAGLNTRPFSFEIWANPGLYPEFAYLASSVQTSSPRSGWYLAQDNGSTFGLGNAYVVRMFYQNGTTPAITLSAPITTAGVWTHIVLTFDGTTATLYTNGVVASSGVPAGYVPNVNAPFSVGERSDIAFNWPGNVAEVAMYPGALSQARVTAHYTAATSAPGTYASTVMADSPLLYDRYQAPPTPVAVNSGTIGSAGNGLYLADAVAGAPGPMPPPYPGFAVGNKAPSFDAGGGAVQLPAFNFNTNTVTISGWVNATNAQEAGAGIVVCDSGSTAGGLIIDGLFGGLGLGYYWNNDANTYNWSPSTEFTPPLPYLPDSDWAYVALVIQPTEADIYIATTNNGGTFSAATNYYAHVNQKFDGVTLIGSDAGDPSYSFNGAIDEVGIWNRSLSSGELYTQFGAAVGGLAPIIFSDPPSPSQPIVAGDTLTLMVNAGGTPNLSYQWLSNSVAIPGATNNPYVKPNFNIASDSGSYKVIVTNSFGSATSGVATVTGQNATAPVIVSGPVGRTVYPGGYLSLSVAATGGGLQFQWKLAGTNLPGATSPTYVVPVVTNINAGSYSVSVTNSLGATNLGPVVVTVPVLASNTYAAVVDADAPDAWWRLDDSSVATGARMLDSMGRHDGVYTNFGGLTGGITGAINSGGGINGTAINFSGDGSYGYVPYFSTLSNSKLTLELWAQQTTVVNGVLPASSFDASGGFGIGTEAYWVGFNGSGYFGSAPGTTAGYDPTIRTGQWVHLAIEFNPAGNSSYPWSVYVNGVNDGFIWSGGTVLNNTGPFIIGGYGTGISTILKYYFVGSVDEVAFYSKLLSTPQLLAHYNAAFYGVPPSFSVQPQSQDAFAGQNITFSATAVGAPPIHLQWKKNGVSLTGQTNTTLTVSNLFYTASSDLYSVTATNSFGVTNSANASVTVYYPPTYANLTNGLVLHMKFDGDYTDSSGRGNNGTPVGSPTLVPGKIGTQAVTLTTDTTNSTYNYVTLGTPTDFLFGSSVDFSVSYWVQMPAGELPGDEPFLCSADNSTGGFGITIAPAYKTGGWAWSLDNSSSAGAGVQGPANTINDGNWHNVVETFSRTGNGITYLDGVQVSSVPIAGIGSIDSGQVFNIGQDPTGSYQESAIFSLDDMGVWTRALTDIEAESIYIVGQNYGKSFDVGGKPVLSMYSLPGGKLGIAWQSGTLKQANTLTGPWTPVVGAAAPFYQFTPTSTNTFYGVGP